MLAGGSNEDLVAELRAIRTDLADIRKSGRETATATGRMKKILDKVTLGLYRVRVESVTL